MRRWIRVLIVVALAGTLFSVGSVLTRPSAFDKCMASLTADLAPGEHLIDAPECASLAGK